jgi:hypothetical protein
MSQPRTIARLLTCLFLIAPFCAGVQAETQAERNQRMRAEREQKAQQRKAEQEQRKRDAASERQAAQGGAAGGVVRHPEAVPRDIDRSDEGFTLRTVAGWLERADEGQEGVALQLIYVNLPVGQQDAGSFRVYVKELERPQTLDESAEAWKKNARWEGEARYGTIERFALDGVQAIAIPAEGTSEGIERVERTTIAHRGGKAYVIHTSSPKNVQTSVINTAKQMERSLKWKGEVTAMPEAPQEAPTSAVIDRTTHGYTFVPAAGWKEFEKQPQGQMTAQVALLERFPGVEYAPTFRVYTYELARARSLEQMVEGWKKRQQFDAPPAFSPVESLTIDGLDALAVQVDGKTGGRESVYRAVFVQRGRREYVLDTITDKRLADRVLPAAQAMEQSLKWVGEVKPWPEVAKAPAPASPPAPAGDAAPAAPGAPAAAAAPAERVVAVSARMKQNVEEASKNLKTFDDEQVGLRFSYPSAWEESKEAAGTFVLQFLAEGESDEIQPTFSFGTFDKSPLAPDPPRTAQFLARMALGKGKAVTNEAFTTGGKPGHLLIYHGEDARALTFVTEHRNQMYTLVFVAADADFEAWLPAVKAMLATVAWL